VGPVLLSGDALALPRGLEREWLLTNALGGYAMGTVAGVNTRAYHGWLVAAEDPPRRRRLRLAKIEIDIAAGGAPPVSLSSNLYPDAVHPDGIRRLLSFSSQPVPTWRYRVGSGVAALSLRLEPGRNAVVATLAWQGEGDADVWLRPLVNDRDHHGRTHRGDFALAVDVTAGGFRLHGGDGLPLWVVANGAAVEVVPDPEPVWIERMRYPQEARRGYPETEDHVSPGRLRVRLGPGGQAAVLVEASTTAPAAPAVPAGDEAVRPRAGSVVAAADLRRDLTEAARAFRVRGRGGRPAVIAGYPWFGERARDSFVAMTGLYLVHDDRVGAGELLARWAPIVRSEPLVAGFDENGDASGLSADAPLWFCLAVYRLWAYGGDVAALRPAVAAVIDAYRAGVGPGGAVRVDDEGLVRADLPGSALTWMDAACPWPVTARGGYPVEVSALWYKALRAADRMGVGGGSYAAAAQASRSAFRARFLRPDGMLYDRILTTGAPDEAIRPNQLVAAGVPFPLLTREEAADLLEALEPQLWTVRGVRTLAPDDVRYHGRYEGTPAERDHAYHEGTVWPWLIGVWADAHRYAYPTGSGPQALNDLLAALRPMLAEGILGQVAEVYDGDPPQWAGGALAMAWSVAELLRALDEWGEGRAPPVLEDPQAAPGRPPGAGAGQ
jgi:predicted glycogen debranching enzyme